MKLPVVPNMERVMAATTMPTLLLGGDPAEGEEEKLFANWAHALTLPGVRGLVVGRSLLYPADGDVVSAIDAAAKLVHPTI
jgi:DhnA family fructose-bisphosphate aldolase class Ia